LCRFSHTSKGSVIADTSISLPIFILCFSLLFSLIYEAGEEDALYRRLAEDANMGSAALGVIDLDVPFMIVSGRTKTRGLERHVLYRPFCGESKDVRVRDVTVYIFPRSGKRYHIAGCSTIDRHPDHITVTRSEAIAAGYTECLLCGKGGRDYFKRRKLIYDDP